MSLDKEYKYSWCLNEWTWELFNEAQRVHGMYSRARRVTSEYLESTILKMWPLEVQRAFFVLCAVRETYKDSLRDLGVTGRDIWEKGHLGPYLTHAFVMVPDEEPIAGLKRQLLANRDQIKVLLRDTRLQERKVY